MLFNASIVGHVGQQPEPKVTKNGKRLTQLRVAVRGKGEDSQWLTVTCWGQPAEYAANYIKKGDTVAAVGDVEIRTYTKSNGDTGFEVELNASKIKGLGKRVRFEEEQTSYGANQDEVPF